MDAASGVQLAKGLVSNWLFGGSNQQNVDIENDISATMHANRRTMNLLPEVPTTTPVRQLSTREQRDCMIIGE